MISVIVYSIEPDLLKRLKDNIARTIGINAHEFLYHHNINNEGIAVVYNRLIRRAKNDIIL